jgi:sugar phosphate isomerase/epimerase
MDTGICTLVDLDVPLAELSRAIAAAGFSHISLSHDVLHSGYNFPGKLQPLRELWDELGLRLDYVHVPLAYYLDLSSLDPQVRRASLEINKLAIRAAGLLGGRGVAVHGMNGDLGPGETVAQRVRTGLESLRELLEYAGGHGVVLGLENLPLDLDCGRVSHELLRASAELDGLGVCLDSCHATIKNPEARALVGELAPRVVLTHFSDTQGGDDSHLIPGQGVADFDCITRELGRAGFSGVVDLECSLWMLRNRTRKGCPHPGDPPLVELGEYLAQAQAAAQRIAQQINAAGAQNAAGPQ